MSATDLEKLVMPGPVIEAHADVEGECGACHARLRDVEERSLCLECHEDVGNDLRTNAGFHARSVGASRADCRVCHSDHRGRNADVVGLDPASFDHDLSDYPLRGAHAGTACVGCHVVGTRHREAPSDCVACHREDDAHEDALGTLCGDCHDEVQWSNARFDHDETEFPLEGSHASVACGLCHAGQRFESTATACQSCHELDDAHRGRFGEECQECHAPKAWKPVHFDHARRTKFSLRGAHSGVDCESCHVDGLAIELSRDCGSCHRADDVHRGRNGQACEQCHGETAWADETFEHDMMTEFPLRGAHSDVKCERCHAGPVTELELETACGSCHENDDVHARQEGADCGECHNEVAWSHDVFFEHDIARFPLLGIHAVTACEQCHASPRFKDAPRDCVSCHADDDVHLRRLGLGCELCHNPNGWQRWRFDHDTQTSFQLHGSHGKLACERCHRAPVKARIELSGDCFACHAKDDRHRGAFGRNCGRCHRDSTWERFELRSID